MSGIETLSKRAAVVSLVALAGLQLALHPDVTWTLRAAGTAAFVAGWLAGGSRSHTILPFWLLLAPLAPALLLFLAGRQGPIVEIVWMAGLTGSLVRIVPSGEWAGPPLWRVLVGGWALVLSLAWPVLAAREAGFGVESLRSGAVINSWAMLTAPQVIAWTLYVVQTQLLGLIWFDWACRSFSADPDRVPRAVHGLWIGVTLASVVAILQGIVDLGFLNVELWTGEGRASGTMLDANAFGTAAAIAGPVGYLALRGESRAKAAGGVIVLAVNWSGVWMSSSRTALLCALIGAVGLAIGILRSRRDEPARHRPLLLAAAAAVAGVVILFAGAIGPLERISGIPMTREGMLSLWNRGGYGTVAVEMLREYPLTGVGVGGYRYLAPDYWREMVDMELQLDNAQNWWRHQAAELGIFGGALVLLWSVAVAWAMVAGRARSTQRLGAWTVRGLLGGIAAISLLGVPTQNPVVLLWFFALVAWMTALVALPRPVLSPDPLLLRTGWTVGAVLAVAYAGGHLSLAAGPLDVADRAKRFGHEYVEGAYAPEPLPDGHEFRWTDDESHFVLPARTRWLVIRVWAHHPDIEQRPVEVALLAPCGTVVTPTLATTTPIAVGVILPAAMETFDGTIRVSRTWTPEEYGDNDRRQLGVGVQTDFVADPEVVRTRDYTVEWPACAGSG